MEKFLMVPNFEEVERDSDNILPLTIEIVDVLMNSAVYY